MKKKFILTMAAAAAIILAGCSKSDDVTPDNGSVKIQLTSGVAVPTRANTQNDQIANGEKISTWVNDATATTALYKALELTADGSGAFAGTTMYFPQSGNGVNIYAIHGNFTETFTEGTTTFPTTLTAQVAEDQTATAEYTKSDLLYSVKKGVARTKNAVSLTFAHMLSKIEVALKPGTGLKADGSEIKSVEIMNTKLSATFTPAQTDELPTDATALSTACTAMFSSLTSSVTPIRINKEITSGNDWSAAVYNEAVIIPQTVANEQQFIKVTLTAGGELYYKLAAETAFASCKKYQYHIIVNLSGLTVTSTITPWTAIGAVTGNAEME